MFLSLVVIYLVVPPNPLVTFISILIMTISLIVTLSGRWRQIAVIGVLAALLSLIAAHFLGLARYGRVGSILVPALWGLVLLLAVSWIQRNMQQVGSDRAIILRNMYTNSVRTLTPPLAPPLMPGIERIIANVPLYTLSADVHLNKVNTPTGHNINLMKIHVHFKVVDRLVAGKIMQSFTNRGHTLQDVAKELGEDYESARADVMFWEKMMIQQMKNAVEDVVRDVVFEEAKNPVDAFQRRVKLGRIVEKQLTQRAEHWGIEILRLDIEEIDVDPERFKAFNKEKIRQGDAEDAHLKAERDADYIRVTRQAEAEAEAARIEHLVRALKESGVPLSPETLEEIVVNAIRATTDWEMETAFTRYPSELPAKPAGDQKGSGDKRPNVSK
jgi:hypothetical protein